MSDEPKSSNELVTESLKDACDALRNQVGFSTTTPAIRSLVYAVEHLQKGVQDLLAAHRELQEEFRTYRQRNAPALSAARMHVPIGGGMKFRSSRGKK